MDKETFKKTLLELWQEYADWNNERHKYTPDPTRYLSFEGFIYWLDVLKVKNPKLLTK